MYLLLKEEIRFNKTGSPDSPVSPASLWSDGDSRLLLCKTVGNFWDSRNNVFESCRDSRENLSKFWRS